MSWESFKDSSKTTGGVMDEKLDRIINLPKEEQEEGHREEVEDWLELYEEVGGLGGRRKWEELQKITWGKYGK